MKHLQVFNCESLPIYRTYVLINIIGIVNHLTAHYFKFYKLVHLLIYISRGLIKTER